MKGTVLAHERTTFKVGRSALYAKRPRFAFEPGEPEQSGDALHTKR
jgi:hypothetical protein